MSNDNGQTIQPQETVVVDETRFTPEQQLELQRLRAETESFKAEAARAQTGLETINAERRGISEKLAMTKGLSESGVRFHSSPSDTEHILKQSYDILTDDNGVTAIDKSTGKVVPLAEAYQHVALANPTLCDQRSLRGLRGEIEPDGTPVIRSKSEFKSTQQRIDYVNKYGLEIFEALPLRPVTICEPKTQEAFRALSLQAKTRFLSEKGLEWLTALPKEPTADDQNRKAGIFVNRVKPKTR
jgi:hypothetical protein